MVDNGMEYGYYIDTRIDEDYRQDQVMQAQRG